ncbi:YitT family protein [Brevibacterium jeotgali]|uniref:Uncharacterized 5xTM membrane BCR, YitT family COG1284 n=1 Tax=Brevibacterium jeotgali TaxID=1262550 RepID=A0A2H1L8P4_9MICO|nr:YitT family protein [Brevibacterium jeotgali]TWC03506.1 putative 5xTM membrane YitT family protein [Brevibacterium jeotgali]SMY13252.1 Uncharacterised 5xTM membrane BCR, YitT family COG1284 [Brevibacterium jeotgali]
MTTSSPLTDVPASPHSVWEDVFGMATGVILVSFGLYLLEAAALVTGGTAGLSLLLSLGTGWPFGLLFVLVNLPFFLLAVRRKGWVFSLKSAVSIGAVSGIAYLHPHFLPLPSLIDDLASGIYVAIVGNLMAGTGLLVLFRHGSSLGGFNIVALIAQEQFGWRAGYVQMALDLCVVIGALFVVPVSSVLISALGAALLNVVLVLNHRPGRYTGY